jgi:hypothetical protein
MPGCKAAALANSNIAFAMLVQRNTDFHLCKIDNFCKRPLERANFTDNYDLGYWIMLSLQGSHFSPLQNITILL